MNPFKRFWYWINGLSPWSRPEPVEAPYRKVPATGTFLVDGGEVREVEPGESLIVTGSPDGLKPGLYEVREPNGPVYRVPPNKAMTEAPAKAGRRKPRPHVTTVAHAGYCLIVDALKAFIRDRMYEPTTVYIDRAAETVLSAYCYETGVVGPPLSERCARVGPTPLLDVRPHLQTLFGCRIVWNAPHFQFAAEEDAPPDQGPPAVPFEFDPFSTQSPKVALRKTFVTASGKDAHGPAPQEARPIDNIDVGRGPEKVAKEDVPEGQALSEQALALLRTTLGLRKLL